MLAAALAAHRELYWLARPIRPRSIKVGPSKPAGVLLGYYREAERRFRVPWNVLAAVNFVESKFGKLRSATFFARNNWQVFVKTPTGDRRVTGPGLP